MSDIHNSSEIVQNAIAAGTKTLQSLARLDAQIAQAADLVTECLQRGNKLLVCGNGGSAADAADFTTEFTCRFMEDRRPYPAMNLSEGGSLITAVGNDYSFEEIFARQVRAFGKSGDVFVAISTSGKSANIERALQEAKRGGLKAIALLGRDGGSAKTIADIDLIVAGDVTARIQEAHKFLLHVICEIVDARLPK